MTITPPERIAKRIARAGVCSRREAEGLIVAGRVRVDGQKIHSPALNVTAEQAITIDGKALPSAEPTRLWLYHKPTGLMTTHKDPEGRPTLFERLPAGMPRVISIGRLDLNSEGLILLTNDGALARHLELPATGWTRRYRVRVHGRVTAEIIERLGKGVTVEGVRYGPVEVKVESGERSNQWVTAGIKEGKNREIRRVFDHVGCKVNRLIRIAYGPFQLGTLPRGELKLVPVKAMRDALGNWQEK